MTGIQKLLSGVALGCLGWSGAATAQDSAATAADTTAQDDAGAIIVTAQRRSQDLQDVPVTITVFGQEEIQDARIQEVNDVVTRTVGLSFDAFPASQPRLAVRGIGSSDRGAAGDPSSAVFIDDVYLGRPAAIAFDAFDIERIEVLKGPQGTLFGRNVVGGAINVITRKPDIDGFDASVEATYGNYNRLDGAGFVNLPFAGNTGAIRVSGAYRSHDGYVRNAFLNQDVDDQETLSGRFQFYAQPTDRFNVLLSLDGTRDRSSGPANHVLELDEEDPLSNFYSQNFDPDVVYGTSPGTTRRDTIGARAEINYDTAFATLSFIGSYRTLDYLLDYDFDGGNSDPASPGFNGVNIAGGNEEHAEFSSQEVRLSSLSGSAVDWVVGLYHYNQQTQRSDTFNLDTALLAPFPLNEIYDQDASLDSIAVFGDATVPLTDQISVIGGLRYTKDDKTYTVSNERSMVPLRGDEFFTTTASASFDAVTFRAGVNFQPTRDHLFYAMVSRGFKSGGFQDTPGSAADAVLPFLPEKATQYEIGQKSTLIPGMLTWNNTLFLIDYTNLQTRQVDDDGQITTSNAGRAEIKGFETQLNFRPFQGASLSVDYAYTDARLKDYIENGDDLSGNRISRTPRHKLTVSPAYTYAFGSGMEVTLAADYRYESFIFDDNSNQGPEVRPATHFVDARIVFDKIADHFSLSLWGKNLTDERTRTWQAVFLGANFGAFNPPRTYGATLRWSY